MSEFSLKLILPDATNLRVVSEDRESVFNIGDDVILLDETITTEELQTYWDDFSYSFEDRLKRLLSMQYGELLNRYGTLTFDEKRADARADLAYGMFVFGTTHKPAHLRTKALTAALVDMDLIPKLTPTGSTRKEFPKGLGHVGDFMATLSIEQQREAIDRIVGHSYIDEYYVFHQYSKAGWLELEKEVYQITSPRSFLERVVNGLNTFLNASCGNGRGLEYAVVWFAQFLASKQAILMPMDLVSNIRRFYPKKLLPMLAWMSVGEDHQDLAEKVLSYRGNDNYTTAQVLNLFASLSASSDMFADNDFNPAALVEIRRKLMTGSEPSRNVRLAATKALYKLLLDHFDINASDRREGPEFLWGGRMIAAKDDLFEWCTRPEARTTRMAERILGHPITVVPKHVQKVALELNEIVNVFQMEHVGPVLNSCNALLVFLMTLPEEDAPSSMREINRYKHVNDNSENPRTWTNFVGKHFAGSHQGYLAPGHVEQAWQHCAIRGGYATEHGNPFDAKRDRLVKPQNAPKKYQTDRPALHPTVWLFLSKANRQDFYSYARRTPRYTYRLLNSTTALFEEVFLPLEAMAVDFLLNTGSRHKTARWLDSGEADEKIVDLETMQYVTNPSKLRERKRQSGVLQLRDVVEDGVRRKITVLRMIHNKTGGMPEFVYVEDEFAANLRHMVDLQSTYNPLRSMVRLRDKKNASRILNVDKRKLVSPLLRVPDIMDSAVSEERVWKYWTSFLVDHQGAVDELMGEHYPLVDEEGRPIFDIHSLRVTMVTNLLEKGVPVAEVKAQVGHVADAMNKHYDANRRSKAHVSIRHAFQQMALVEKVVDHDPIAIEEMLGKAYTDGHEEGLALLSVHSSDRTAPLEEFAHGLCPGGNCAKGGELKGGSRQPVWRTRACSRCVFRVTGTPFLGGLISNHNKLVFELRDSVTKIGKYNEAKRRSFRENGKTDSWLKRRIDSEMRIQEQLMLDKQEEYKTIIGCLAIRDRLIAEGATGLALIAAEGVPLDDVVFGFKQGSQFELLHQLVEDTLAFPHSVIDMPTGLTAIYREQVNAALRANDLDALLFKLDTKDMIDVGKLVINFVGEPGRVQQAIDEAMDGRAFPGLGAAIRRGLGSRPAFRYLGGPHA